MNMTAIAIVGIVCWAIVELVNTIFKKRNATAGKDVGNMQEEIASLKERVATLEKIVTDEKYQLNKEFENLKDR